MDSAQGRRATGMRGVSTLLLGVALCLDVQARVLHVESDGSGEYTRLYEASLAAVSGDTIQVGPGVYVSTPEHDFGGGPVKIHGFALVEDLTILGAGGDQTTLATPLGPGSFDSPFGIVSFGNANVTIRGIQFRDLGEAVQASGKSAYISNCTFQSNYAGASLACADSQSVVESTFYADHSVFASAIIVYSNLPSRRARIEDCEFLGIGSHVQIQAKESVIRRCSFEGRSATVTFGGELLIEDSDFRGPIGGAGVSGGSSLEVRRCRFTNLGQCLYQEENGNLYAHSNTFEGGTYSTISVDGFGVIAVNENNLLNAGGFSVIVSGLNSGSPPNHLDFQDNFWGTTDSTLIAGWIHDALDDPRLQSIVDYEPIAPSSVPIESMSLGFLRSLFRPTER